MHIHYLHWAWVLLKVAFYIFVGINILMKGKPAIAIALAIKDYIKLDKKAFRGYGFWCYSGLGGSGKTVSMVDYLIILRRKYPKLKIYTNFDFDYSDGYLEKWQDIVQLTNFEYVKINKEEYDKIRDRRGDKKIEHEGVYYKIVNNGIVFGFDEIHLTLESAAWKDAPPNLLEHISQQRKNHKMILSSSQVFTRINKVLREQTNYIVECKSMFMGRLVFNKFYYTDTFVAPEERKGKKKQKTVKRYSFVAYDSIREKYDTEQIMVKLVDTELSEEERFKKDFRRYFNIA